MSTRLQTLPSTQCLQKGASDLCNACIIPQALRAPLSFLFVLLLGFLLRVLRVLLLLLLLLSFVCSLGASSQPFLFFSRRYCVPTYLSKTLDICCGNQNQTGGEIKASKGTGVC